MKFPLSLILTSDIIFKYNKIFRLLITAKQAVIMISQLQTKGTYYINLLKLKVQEIINQNFRFK